MSEEQVNARIQIQLGKHPQFTQERMGDTMCIKCSCGQRVLPMDEGYVCSSFMLTPCEHPVNRTKGVILIESQILLAKLMGYRTATLEERIKWIGGDEERMLRMNPNYVPILMKGEFDEPLFADSMSYDTNYNWIMEVVEEVNKRDWVTIYADSCKIHALNNDEFETIEVTNEGQPMIKSIFEALVQYAKLNLPK